MRAPTRGLLATPAFLAYAYVALTVGGTDGLGGVALLALGAIAAGYLVGSPWGLAIAAPFIAYGLATLGDSGPLENTRGGWGSVILIFVALPVTAGALIGVVLRRTQRRSVG
jgi:hypothetical protein